MRQWKNDAEEMQRRGTAIYVNDMERNRRLEVEKDFRNIHTFIINNDMRGAPLEFFALVDELMEKYCSDSFFAHSSLLEMLGNMADILTIKTSPNKPIIPFDYPIVKNIESVFMRSI